MHPVLLVATPSARADCSPSPHETPTGPASIRTGESVVKQIWTQAGSGTAGRAPLLSSNSWRRQSGCFEPNSKISVSDHTVGSTGVTCTTASKASKRISAATAASAHSNVHLSCMRWSKHQLNAQSCVLRRIAYMSRRADVGGGHLCGAQCKPQPLCKRSRA